MGLPLFVAPVESDIPQKASRKDASTSPRRSSIRRMAHITATRERAILNRRARTLEHHERRRGLPGIGQIDALTSPASPADTAMVARYISMGFTSPTDIARHDAQQDELRDGLRAGMDLRFGPDWRDRNWEHPQQDLNLDWWVVEPRLFSGTARLTRLIGHRLDLTETPHRPRHIDIVPSASWGISRTGSSRVSPSNRSLPWGRPSRRPLPTADNGLGDRDRSLSPEGWDTLLTTLTPDPQPPSINSSFTSTAVSQESDSSPMTSMGSDAPADAVIDQPCDSECSDTEGNDGTRRARQMRRSGSRAERITDAPVLGSVRFHVPSFPTDARGDNGLPVALRAPHVPSPHRIGADEGYQFHVGRRPGLWIGHLSVGASDDEQSSERPSISRENSTGSRITSRDDGELTGMQRILRRLSDRDDIPDEWWAEAGLRRSLTRGAHEP